jgi:hypothetical protein
MAIYKNGRPFGSIITDGLILNLDAVNPASYPGTGATWFDTSGGGNNGTLTNSPTYTVQGGQTNFTFNGTTNYITCSPPALPSFTLESWAYKTSATQGNLISRGGAGEFNFYFRIGANSGFSNNGGIFNEISTANPTLNTWAHFVLTYSNNSFIYYRNNILTTQTTTTITPYAGSIGTTEIGRLVIFAVQNWPGAIANMKVYNRALSASEISQNYNALKSRFGY